MRAFIVVCLLAVAFADKLGYNYQPVGHSVSGLSFTPGSSSGNLGGGIVSTPVVNSGLGGSYGGISGGVPDGLTSVVSGGPIAGVSSGSYDDASVNYAPQVELEKEFYTFTANDDDFNEPAVQNQVLNSAKKNLRVIFIKGPENHGFENAAVALAKHSAEQKTAIYVLHKQADLNSLSQKLNAINNNVNNKPEVHFVKYRTPEDAINAQKAIQGQYDSLGGNSQSYNGGVAPVLNFASQAPVATHGSIGSIGSYGTPGSLGTVGPVGSVQVSAPTNSYIPPVVGGSVSIPGASYLPAIVARHRK